MNLYRHMEIHHNSHLLLFRHAPLGERSVTRRHQPPQRTVLGQVDCFVQCEAVGSQIALDGFSHVIQGCPGGLFQLSVGEQLDLSWHLCHHPYVQYAPQIWKDAGVTYMIRDAILRCAQKLI